MGVCHVEGLEGRATKRHYRFEIRRVRVMAFTRRLCLGSHTPRERLYHGDGDGEVCSWDLPG